MPENVTSQGSWLSNLPSFITGVCAVAFCGSVIFDFVYLTVLGTGLFEMPTTVADHVRSGVLWIPAAAFGFVLGNLYRLFKVARRGSQDNDDGNDVGVQPTAFQAWASWFLRSVCLMVIVAFLLVGGSGYIVVPLAVLWLWVGVLDYLDKKYLPPVPSIVLLVSGLLLIPTSMGFHRAMADLNPKIKNTHIVRLAGDEASEVAVVVLRTFDRGILVRNTDPMNLTFITWPSIIECSAIEPSSRFKGFLNRSPSKPTEATPTATPSPAPGKPT